MSADLLFILTFSLGLLAARAQDQQVESPGSSGVRRYPDRSDRYFTKYDSEISQVQSAVGDIADQAGNIARQANDQLPWNNQQQQQQQQQQLQQQQPQQAYQQAHQQAHQHNHKRVQMEPIPRKITRHPSPQPQRTPCVHWTLRCLSTFLYQLPFSFLPRLP